MLQLVGLASSRPFFCFVGFRQKAPLCSRQSPLFDRNQWQVAEGFFRPIGVSSPLRQREVRNVRFAVLLMGS